MNNKTKKKQRAEFYAFAYAMQPSIIAPFPGLKIEVMSTKKKEKTKTNNK